MKKLPHVLTALLVTILIACGSSNQFADDAKSGIEDQNYDAALKSAEQSIEKFPGDPLGYYYKAVSLGEIGSQKSNPADRVDYYNDMNKFFETAKTIADTAEEVPNEINRIPTVRNVLWQTEHNKAINYIKDDSLKKTVDDPQKRALQHLRNATIVQPDSSLSWNVRAQVAAVNKEFKEAVDAKNKFISMVDTSKIEPQDYRQLASYYYNLDMQEKVVEALKRGQEHFPNNEKIVSNLADSYNRIGESEKAIAAVEQLVKQEPENPQYHLVLGTQIYQRALKIKDTLSTNSEKIIKLRRKAEKASGKEKEQVQKQVSKLIEINNGLQSRIDELTNRAEKELETTLKYRPDDSRAYNTLGVIHQNKAKAIFDERNRTEDNEKAAELKEQGQNLLRESMKYYEKAVELKPENQDYWRRLFEIYTALGMDKKAKEAMKKAGMN